MYSDPAFFISWKQFCFIGLSVSFDLKVQAVFYRSTNVFTILIKVTFKLKCSIWGTNNKLPNIFYDFFQFQLFDVKFLFPEKKMYFPDRKHAYYGRTSLLSGLNAPVKMMTCYLWGRNKFLRYYNLFIKPTKMLIPDKRYCTYMVCIFWVTWSA